MTFSTGLSMLSFSCGCVSVIMYVTHDNRWGHLGACLC